MNILIMDDEPILIELLQEVFEIEGYQVHTAPNGENGLDLIQQGLTPQMILTDLYMPKIGGKEFIEIIRNQYHLSDIPVVLMTGAKPNADDLPPEGTFRDLFYKPLNICEVVKKINRIINLKTSNNSWAG